MPSEINGKIPVPGIDDERLKAIVSKVSAFTAVARVLEISERSKNMLHLKARIRHLKFDISHFVGENRVTSSVEHLRIWGDHEIIPSQMKTDKLIDYLFDRNLKQNHCEICSQTPEWMGKPLKMKLNFINNTVRDLRLENLRVLCPNCYSQAAIVDRRRKGKPLGDNRAYRQIAIREGLIKHESK